jgi:hypothetical protein
MIKLPGAVAAALVCIVSPAADAQAQEEMETVLVTGEQPGPGLWKVSRDGHVMWVLGSIYEVPETITWQTREMEARIAESQEVLYPGWPDVRLDVSAFQFVTLVPSAYKAAKNPGGAMLKDVLSPEAYATWLRLKQKYLGDDDDIEKYRPMVAEDKLNTAMSKEAWKAWKGIRFIPVDSVVHKAAKKHNVRIHTLPAVKHRIKVEKPRAILKAARNMDLAEGECVGRNLARMEKRAAAGLQAIDVAATNAWATGDLETLRAKAVPDPDLQSEDCTTAALDAATEKPTEISRGLDLFKQQEELSKLAGQEAEHNWVEAAEAALAKNVSTFAVLPIHLVTNEWVYIGNLKRKGYVVEYSQELRSTTENAAQGAASVK